MIYRRIAVLWVLSVLFTLVLFACSNQPGGGTTSDLITISGTISFPAPQSNKTWVIFVFTNDTSGYIGGVGGYTTPGSTTFSYTITNLPKGKYLFATGVDVNDDHIIGNSGDYFTNYPGLIGYVTIDHDTVLNYSLYLLP